MLHFDITPGIGVGPVRLGMTRAEVHRALGAPDARFGEREGFLSGFMVNYDSTERVEFIELANSPRFSAFFEGVCLHHIPAAHAVALVSRFDTFDPTVRDLGYSYIFLNLQMSLWRSRIVNESEEVDPEDARGYCFEAVGVAVPGYFVPANQVQNKNR
jgi:hypothetical protein